MPDDAQNGGGHYVDWDSCGFGDGRKDWTWYVCNPGTAAVAGRDGGHDGGMGAALSVTLHREADRHLLR